jgi:signal transduction histidine kinase
LTRRDGTYFGTLCTLDPDPIEHGDDILAIFRLLSTLIAFQLEEEEQSQRREEHIRTLEDIMAISGHDIRQPLTAAYGGLQLLARQANRGQAVDIPTEANRLAATVRRAITLSETLLDVARTEVSGFAIERAPFDLVRLSRQVLDEARAVSPDHRLLLHAPETLCFHGDERRLGRVLRNLLDNALKYAPASSGPIELALIPDAHEFDQPGVEIVVSDSGLGVPDDLLPLLFKRHYRTEQAVDGGIQGSGLGLYIVRQIVEAHGGRVWAAPSSAGGLAIHVHLPRNVRAT